MMPGESAVKGDRLVERGSKAAKCPGSGPSEWKLVVLSVVVLAERAEAVAPEMKVVEVAKRVEERNGAEVVMVLVQLLASEVRRGRRVWGPRLLV